MMRIYFLIFIFLPLFSFADSGINLVFNDKTVSQGRLHSAEMNLDLNTLSILDSKKLSGATVGETLYIVDVSPFMRNDAGAYNASATVIFLKIPKEEAGVIDTAKGKVSVKWGAIEVLPTEAPETFLFGSFEIPQGSNLLTLLSVLIGVLVLLFPIKKLYERRKNQRALKKQLDLLKKDIFDAHNYEGIVNIWKRKHDFLSVFPQTRESFQKFEEVLFKVQFKPTQSESEKERVVNAYLIFLDEIKGVMGGI